MLDANAVLESTSSSVDSPEPAAANLETKAIREFEPPVLDLKPGNLVEVRSAAEVMSSLDADGKLDGLPFMPEMLALCGRRLRVSKRADNTCALGQPRRIERTVHLEQTRCDGSAHRGCEAGCLFLWKEAWLRRVTAAVEESGEIGAAVPAAGMTDGAYRLLSEFAQKPNNTLMCQSTELASASCPAPVGKSSSYFVKVARDSASGKRSLGALRQLLIYFWGKAILYSFILWTRAPWNKDRYHKTPATPLDLQPGEVVRVRGMFEILQTLDRKGCNRGMEFKPEMFQFCGRRYPVILNMQRRIDERSGELKGFRSPCIVLESVYCQGQRSFCQRANYHYWREIWLSRD
jgi:hypothetical protein